MRLSNDRQCMIRRRRNCPRPIHRNLRKVSPSREKEKDFDRSPMAEKVAENFTVYTVSAPELCFDVSGKGWLLHEIRNLGKSVADGK
jgi:hypothetical protein